MKINKRILTVVFIAELVFCSGEGLMLIASYPSGREAWPWFFSMVVNLPASIVVMILSGNIYDKFNIDSFGIQNVIAYLLFLIIGTIWWALIAHFIRWLWMGKNNENKA